MRTKSRRYQSCKALVTSTSYSLEEGFFLLKKMSTVNFIESLEAHVSLNIDPQHSNQRLRATLILPNGTGNNLRIAIFTESESVNEMLQLGATIAGADDLLDQIRAGRLDFDVLLTTPQLMPQIVKLGRILGPKGLMPSPKAGTVTSNIREAICEFKKGKLEYRADKTGIVHLSFGKVNFSINQLKENLFSVYNSIIKNKPDGVKGKYFKTFYICTTMSPSIKLDLVHFK